MSHWTTIKTSIRELSALSGAVAELGCTLITPQNLIGILDPAERQNCTGQAFGHPGKVMARGWAGRTSPCDAFIRIPGCAYDVALDRQSDGSYSVRADLYSGQVEQKLGMNFTKLKQMYGVHHATAIGRKLGHNVGRVMRADGTINVVYTGRI